MNMRAWITVYAAATIGISAMVTAPASAANPPVLNASVQNKRQLIGCMNKQMSASRTISYNEATKLCKDLMKTASEVVARSDAAASDTSKPGTAR
jgi:hypothetical protein